MNLWTAEIEAEIGEITWMLELGATIIWSIVKEIPSRFQLDEIAFVEGSSDLCKDRCGLSWDGMERNVVVNCPFF